MTNKEIAKEFYSMLDQYAIIETIGVFITNEGGALRLSLAFEMEIIESMVFVGGFCNEENIIPVMLDFMGNIEASLMYSDVTQGVKDDGFYILRFFLKKEANVNSVNCVIADIHVIEYLTFKEFAERTKEEELALIELLEEIDNEEG